jgi:hypothetical protein
MEVCGVPQILEEWWAYRRTYHAHVRDELGCRTLKEKCLSTIIKALVGDIEGRETLDTSSVGQRSILLRHMNLLSNSKDARSLTCCHQGILFAAEGTHHRSKGSPLLQKLINKQMLSGIKLYCLLEQSSNVLSVWY